MKYGSAVATALGCLLVAGAFLGARLGSAPASAGDIPADYLALYRAAAERFELGPLGWSVLAAVGKIECDQTRANRRLGFRGRLFCLARERFVLFEGIGPAAACE